MERNSRYRNYHRSRIGRKTINLLFILIALLVIGVSAYLFKEEILTSLNPNQCPNNIIPSVFIFIRNTDPMGVSTLSEYPENPPLWFDGQYMQFNTGFPFSEPCHKGSGEGENINYFYCKEVTYTNSTTEISKEGIIGKTTTISYSISFVLKENSFVKDTLWGKAYSYSLVSAKCKRLK